MSRLITFDNLHNTRDLGGMITKDGRKIADGMLIRSGHLYAASEADLKKLSGSVDVIVDFRTNKEKNEKPDPFIGKAVYYHLPIIDSLTAGVTREKDADEKAISMLMQSPQKAKEYMCNTYMGFVGGEFPISQYEKFVRLLLEDRCGAILWHCTAGKDRAGFASVIIEEILGVDRNFIIEDYLKTNEYLAEEVKGLKTLLFGQLKKANASINTDNVTQDSGEKPGINEEKMNEAFGYLFGAKEEYINTLYTKIEADYGSFGDFVINGLHISYDEQELLRKKYLQ